MAEKRYRRPHLNERALWHPIVEGGRAVCAEPRCVIEEEGGSRRIEPGSDWHLSHDPSGKRWIGPSHARCNLAENARRNNPKRAEKRRRWVL